MKWRSLLIIVFTLIISKITISSPIQTHPVNESVSEKDLNLIKKLSLNFDGEKVDKGIIEEIKDRLYDLGLVVFEVEDISRFYVVRAKPIKGKKKDIYLLVSKDLEFVFTNAITSERGIDILQTYLKNKVKRDVMKEDNIKTAILLSEVIGKEKAIKILMELQDKIKKIKAIKDFNGVELEKLQYVEQGSKNRPTTAIYVFEDITCKHCKSFNERALPALAGKFTVRILYIAKNKESAKRVCDVYSVCSEDLNKNKEIFNRLRLKGVPVLLLPVDNGVLVTTLLSQEDLLRLLKIIYS